LFEAEEELSVASSKPGHPFAEPACDGLRKASPLTASEGIESTVTLATEEVSTEHFQSHT